MYSPRRRCRLRRCHHSSRCQHSLPAMTPHSGYATPACSSIRVTAGGSRAAPAFAVPPEAPALPPPFGVLPPALVELPPVSRCYRPRSWSCLGARSTATGVVGSACARGAASAVARCPRSCSRCRPSSRTTRARPLPPRRSRLRELARSSIEKENEQRGRAVASFA